MNRFSFRRIVPVLFSLALLGACGSSGSSGTTGFEDESGTTGSEPQLAPEHSAATAGSTPETAPEDNNSVGNSNTIGGFHGGGPADWVSTPAGTSGLSGQVKRPGTTTGGSTR